MKYLGIDFGLRRVGLALGDADTRVAVPIETVLMDEKIWDRLGKLVREEAIQEMVVGMPRSLRDAGVHGEIATLAKDFIDECKSRFSLAVHEEDERFSTALANRLLKTHTKKDRDSVAAAAILQSYLDRTA